MKSKPKYSPQKTGQIELDLPVLNHNNNNNNIQQPLLDQPAESSEFRTISVSQGVASYTNPADPENKHKKYDNSICNQKYNVVTFVPKVLYEQFKYFFNMFYLVIAISQFIPALSVGLLFSYVAPLVLVLFLTMLKEGYEDYQRFVKDKQANCAEYNVMTYDFDHFKQVQSKNLKVGDVIEMVHNQRVPADVLLIYTNEPTHTIFVKTDQLDGETDWKVRKPIGRLQKSLAQNTSLDKISFVVKLKNPDLKIYSFEGAYEQQNYVEGLNLEHTAWAGMKLACGKALGIVIYVGKQMKMTLNSKEPATKFGRLDEELNFYSKLLFLMMVTLSTILILMKGSSGSNFGQESLTFFKYLLLLSSIIPISMRVNLDFAKLTYSYLISKDGSIPQTTVRNSNIPEELGRIEYILSDKTGTLTKNEMLFKKLVIDENNSVEAEQLHTLIEGVSNLCRKQPNSGPMSDYGLDKKVTHKRSNQQIWRDLVTSLIVCHNVTPAIEDGERVLQGSSPDQVALVRLAEQIGYKLEERSQTHIKLKNISGHEQNYEVLALFPFTSERKRMGIIVLHKETNRYIFYLKGADTIMKPKISVESKANIMTEACTDLATEGLRTLVFCQKLLSAEYYNDWQQRYDEAKALMTGREAAQNKVIQSLEQNMDFLAITGVEDKLQDNIQETISNLRGAGIGFWMLTGDKIETAICISVSTRIKSKEQRIFIMQDRDAPQLFRSGLQELYEMLGCNSSNIKDRYFKDILLVIDGNSLKMALLPEFSTQFFDLASRMPSVVCSRCSPTQKADITHLLRENTHKKVLAIGDGGNDVGMIQSADVGIGIYGKEGIQAALASDFSITQFSFINCLILWHGRQSYKRSCVLSQFIIHRGLIISFMQAIFTATFFFVAIPIFNGALMLGYSTVFTLLPAFSLIFDQDVTRAVAFKYPLLYKSVQVGGQLNAFTFIYWNFISIYQGAVIMFLILVFFKTSSFYLVTTVSFTCLIFIEYLNVFFSINNIPLNQLSQIHHVHIIHIVSNILSAGVYILTMYVMKNTLNPAELITTDALLYTIIIVLVAWLPPFVCGFLKKRLWPNQQEKLMKLQKTGLIQFSINP